ncbi:putative bifunctional diguanylate cyclase/phosphodiesterase [Allorhizobium pseudoryzae]|uniref:putative bifunctional diguanylate cyclase/phosphodiesterase n=1 Tax=Allorhizobium pseudoryzae TaxID=379684 RepID=UPI003D03B84A
MLRNSSLGNVRGREVAWRNSIFGKVTLFLLLAVAISYVTGAATGWVMIERSQREDWRRQASTNAQIASSVIRSIYTFVSVDLTDSAQIEGIKSETMIGDDQSVLDTGFVALDVLALAAIQTKEKIWLASYHPENGQLLTLTDNNGSSQGSRLELEQDESDGFFHFTTGFAKIGAERHYVAIIPIKTPGGTLLGAIVASAGEASRLLEMQASFYRNSLLYGAISMILTALVVVFTMRRLFHPIPKLIESLKRIAREDTGDVTPFQHRRDEIGRLAAAIETLREGVVEREQLRRAQEAARELEHLALHDPLTGLPNRAFLQKTLSAMLGRIVESGRIVNVMLLDLDRFKPVNDTYGHAIGDQLLIGMAQRITPLMGPEDILTRLGGDEFALIQSVSVNARKEARHLGNRIIEAINQPFEIAGHPIGIGISIGVATAPFHGTTNKDVMAHADIALYTSKGAGRGCLRMYEPGMTMEGSGRSAIEVELLQALAENQFQLLYQPIVRTATEEVAGYEALIRWHHPKKGLVSPDTFIPAAEETNIILDLDRWVVQQACREMALRPDGLSVAVNLSALSLQRPDLPDFLRRTLTETGLSPERLEIEITESHRAQGTEVTSNLNDIRAMGIGIAVDDFGTGFSSMSYLMDLPVTRIKLDRRFVSGVVNDPRCLNVVRSSIALARGLEIEVTAEGIEDRGQLDVIRSLGCRSAQGYLFGKPALLPELNIPRIQAPPLRAAL